MESRRRSPAGTARQSYAAGREPRAAARAEQPSAAHARQERPCTRSANGWPVYRLRL